MQTFAVSSSTLCVYIRGQGQRDRETGAGTVTERQGQGQGHGRRIVCANEGVCLTFEI